MRRHLLAALAAGAALALAAVGIASAEKPTVVQAGNSLPVIGGGFAPKALPRKGRPAPLTLGLSARVTTVEGEVPPTLREVSLELDRHITADATGMASCSRRKVERVRPAEGCRSALVGKGVMDVYVHFPEQSPFTARSKLFAFNAGVKHGTPMIFLHAYLASPLNKVVLTTVAVTKIDRERYGTKWLFDFPEITGGYGSISDFTLEINRQFPYMGEEKSFLLARCPDGHLDGRATSVFADGSTQMDSFVRSCSPKP